MDKRKVIICRCEDVDLKQIHDLFEQGFVTFEDIKRLTRIGMGACQGRDCAHLLQVEIAKYTNQALADVETMKVRPMLLSVPLKSIIGGDKDES